MIDPHRRNVGVAFGTLLASSATLVCCVLPAVLVSLGAGAVLVGLISAFPQLVWLSEHKSLVFGIAGVLLAASGALLWHARRLPCPVDPGRRTQLHADAAGQRRALLHRRRQLPARRAVCIRAAGIRERLIQRLICRERSSG